MLRFSTAGCIATSDVPLPRCSSAGGSAEEQEHTHSERVAHHAPHSVASSEAVHGMASPRFARKANLMVCRQRPNPGCKGPGHRRAHMAHMISGLLPPAKGNESYLRLQQQQEGTYFSKYFLASRFPCMSADVSNTLRHGFSHGVMPLPNHHLASEAQDNFHLPIPEM